MSEVLAPWQDPATAGFYEARGEENALEVKLDAEATKAVWAAYQQGKKGGRWHLLTFTFDGHFSSSFYLQDNTEALVGYVLQRRLCVYNVRRKKCWRPIWHGSQLDKRSMNNFSYESVVLYGYKSFIEGWEHRPKARFFAND